MIIDVFIEVDLERFIGYNFTVVDLDRLIRNKIIKNFAFLVKMRLEFGIE